MLQGHFRLGCSLVARKNYAEAMKSFSRSLQLLLDDSSSKEHQKMDTLNQLLSVALTHPGNVIESVK